MRTDENANSTPVERAYAGASFTHAPAHNTQTVTEADVEREFVQNVGATLAELRKNSLLAKKGRKAVKD